MKTRQKQQCPEQNSRGVKFVRRMVPAFAGGRSHPAIPGCVCGQRVLTLAQIFMPDSNVDELYRFHMPNVKFSFHAIREPSHLPCRDYPFVDAMRHRQQERNYFNRHTSRNASRIVRVRKIFRNALLFPALPPWGASSRCKFALCPVPRKHTLRLAARDFNLRGAFVCRTLVSPVLCRCLE
jgi:hypothetical protein